MSIVKRAGDFVYTLRFLKLLVTPFEETQAYKLGLIDKNGKRDKSVKVSSPEQRAAYTSFHRLVFNLKKLLEKAPGGRSVLASYAAALFLLKEKFGVSQKQLDLSLQHYGFEPLDFLDESSDWFILEDGRLSPGSYKLRHNKVLNETCDELVRKDDYVRVGEDAYPVGQIYGLNIYEGIHVRSNQAIYFTVGELKT